MGQVRPRAAVLATVGALAIAASAYFDWVGNQGAGVVPLRRLLFVDIEGEAASYWQSMAAPLVMIGALGVLGALLLNRVVLLISILLALATTALWVATTDVFDAGWSVEVVGVGTWMLSGGVLVTLVGLIALRRRREPETGYDENDGAVRPAPPYGGDPTTRIGPGTSHGTPPPPPGPGPRPGPAPEAGGPGAAGPAGRGPDGPDGPGGSGGPGGPGHGGPATPPSGPPPGPRHSREPRRSDHGGEPGPGSRDPRGPRDPDNGRGAP